MAKDRRNEKEKTLSTRITGTHAVLGVDIVSFSTLTTLDMYTAITELTKWIRQALAFNDIEEKDYLWSHGGDGGYLTFATTASCAKAIDVAIAVANRNRSSTFRRENGKSLELRIALHAGIVQESDKLGLGIENEVWGMAINNTARILSVCRPSQILVSRQYFDHYVKEVREHEFQYSASFTRTVKHGRKVDVMNFSKGEIGLNEKQASSVRWQNIGAYWERIQDEYELVADDAMRSGDTIAALVAAKFLDKLGNTDKARKICRIVGDSTDKPDVGYPISAHPFFSRMPPDILYRVIVNSIPRIIRPDEIIFKKGQTATSCFFLVAGDVTIERPFSGSRLSVPIGQIFGEFSLWASNIKRTATLSSHGDGLLLEIPTKEFQEVLRSAKNIERQMNELIQRRIKENVFNSSELFPEIMKTILDKISAYPETKCEKHSVGTVLNIDRTAYLLFNGRVQINGKGGKSLEVSAEGGVRPGSVIGIYSQAGADDGTSATVLDESITLSLEHHVLSEIQSGNPEINKAWNRIYGERVGEFKRAK